MRPNQATSQEPRPAVTVSLLANLAGADKTVGTESVIYHTVISDPRRMIADRSLKLVQRTRGFGLAGESPPATIDATAIAAERAGYHTFWLSQPAGGNSLSALARLAGVTQTVGLGVGVIPFTLWPAEEIAGQVCGQSLPHERLRLGVGSGTGAGALVRLCDGVRALRSLLDVEIVVAPLGPKMCRLAGGLADTVLLNWLTPAYALTSVAWIEEGAALAGRRTPAVCAYVRCALGAAARPRLETECARYGSFPHYAAHFNRQGVDPSDTTIWAASATEIEERLDSYAAVLDQVVVRAITPNDAIDEVLSLIEVAKPSV